MADLTQEQKMWLEYLEDWRSNAFENIKAMLDQISKKGNRATVEIRVYHGMSERLGVDVRTMSSYEDDYVFEIPGGPPREEGDGESSTDDAAGS